MAAGLDQRVDERVAVGERALHLHAVGVQRVEQLERAGRRVQPHRHAHLGVLGGEARQHDGHASVGRRQRAQPRRAHGQPGHARAALGVGDVARHGHADGRVVRVALLERDDARQQAPVELGDRDLRGRVERGQAGRAGLPRRARARRAHRLQHRHVEGDERAGVPLVGGARAAGGEHGRQQRVDVAVEQRQRGHVAVAVAPQRVAPDRKRIAARGLDGARTARRRSRCCRSGGASGRSRCRSSAGRDRGPRARARAARRPRRAGRRRGRRPRAAPRTRGPRAGTCRRGSAGAARRCRRRRDAGTRPPGPRRRPARSRARSSRRRARPRRPGRAGRCRSPRSAAAAGRSRPAIRAARRAPGTAPRGRRRGRRPRTPRAPARRPGWRSAPPGSRRAGAAPPPPWRGSRCRRW